MNEQPPSDQPPYQGGNPPPPNQPYYGGNNPPPNQPQYPPYGQNNPPPPGQPPYGGPYSSPPQPPYGTPPGYNPPPGGAPPSGYGAPPPGGQPPYNPGYPPNYVQPPKKRGGRGWIIGIIAVALVLVLACVVGFGALIGLGVNAKGEAEKALDDFMRVAATGNVDAAYALVTPSITKEQFKTGFMDPTSGYLADYDSLTTSGFSVNSNNGSTTAALSGTVRYKTKGSGPFSATLEQVSGKWRIVNLDVRVPS